MLRKDAPRPSGDLPSVRGVRNADPSRTDDALPRACPFSLLAVGRPLAIYRGRVLAVSPCVSAHPDDAALFARDRDRLLHLRNVLPRPVLSPRQVAVLGRADPQPRQEEMSSASSTRMTNGSKHEGAGCFCHRTKRSRYNICHVGRSRLPSRSFMRRLETSLTHLPKASSEQKLQRFLDRGCPERSSRARNDNERTCYSPFAPKMIDNLFNSFTCHAVPGTALGFSTCY